MLATMSQPAPPMSLPSPQQSPPKRPRLSLQTKSVATPTVINTAGVAVTADIDPTSATAFNTLSNAYAAAIESSSPKTASLPPFIARRPLKSSLRLVTHVNGQSGPMFPSQHTQTPGPFAITYPDTPTAAYSNNSPLTAHPDLRGKNPSFTFTPPQSAHPSDEVARNALPFATRLAENAACTSPRTPRRRATTGTHTFLAPYTHPRTLHSILRNSPLPPRSSLTPMSPTRASRRLADRAAKKLCFNNPLTQTITNERYIKSHIDLLAEEASPYSAIDPEAENFGTLDLTMAYDGDETRDGGQTPGPFEEMRRRMASLEAESDAEAPANKKRKRKEKKRQWVWTIGTNEDDSDIGDHTMLNPTGFELSKPADPIVHSANLVHHAKIDDACSVILQPPSKQAPNAARPPPSELSQFTGFAESSEPGENLKRLEQTKEKLLYPLSDGAGSVTVTSLPESLFGIQIPTFKINFTHDREMIDRPGSSQSI